MTTKESIIKKMAALEKDYRAYQQPDVMVKLKSSVLDDLWDIFGTSVLKPEAASFVVGRMFEAFRPYRETLTTISDYEELEARLIEIQKQENEEIPL